MVIGNSSGVGDDGDAAGNSAREKKRTIGWWQPTLLPPYRFRDHHYRGRKSQPVAPRSPMFQWRRSWSPETNYSGRQWLQAEEAVEAVRMSVLSVGATARPANGPGCSARSLSWNVAPASGSLPLDFRYPVDGCPHRHRRRTADADVGAGAGVAGVASGWSPAAVGLAAARTAAHNDGKSKSWNATNKKKIHRKLNHDNLSQDVLHGRVWSTWKIISQTSVVKEGFYDF